MKTELRIDWSEIDAFGHVNNLAIMKYVQAARVSFLEALGLIPCQPEMKIGPILASISCQFRKPLFYPGRVTVHSSADEIKTTSFGIRYVVCNAGNETAAEAHDILVLYDFQTQRKVEIPEELRHKIKSTDHAGRLVMHAQAGR
jgi:acyl-CoA thioester hydrolase